jgi:hypothetical protein
MGRDGFLEICTSTAPIGCNEATEGPSDFTPERPLIFRPILFQRTGIPHKREGNVSPGGTGKRYRWSRTRT